MACTAKSTRPTTAFVVWVGGRHDDETFCSTRQRRRPRPVSSTWVQLSSDWSNFGVLDGDDDDLDKPIDNRRYAKEEDTQEDKAQVGSSLEPPDIENDAPPIFVPAGSELELDEATVLGVLSACRQEIGTMFGYTAENRGVGITGGYVVGKREL